jgi:hypothetical protein
MSERVLEALERVLDGADEADDVLRAAVALLVDEPGVSYAEIAFLEEGELVPGPHAGDPDEEWCVADFVSAHVLIGWDTGGERWQP